MLSFSFSAAKMKKGDLSIAKGHNLRTHDTESQLPKSAWLAKEARYTFTRWNDDQGKDWNDQLREQVRQAERSRSYGMSR